MATACIACATTSAAEQSSAGQDVSSGSPRTDLSTADAPPVGVSVAEAVRSDAAPTEAATPAAPTAGIIRARAPHRPVQRPAAPTIEDRVRLLTRGLDLDPSQQARLRELLESERREIKNLWSSTPTVSDRVSPTLAIIERTKDQIRAMLTEQQQTKYPAAVPRKELARAQADAEYWMRLAQPRPGEGAGSAN